MSAYGLMPHRVARILLRSAARFIGSRRGNIGVLSALLIIPIVGALGLATEGGGWFLVGRAAQVAADQAALAAASNNDAAVPSTGYQLEGQAVASKYGFTNGSDHATVTLSYKTIASIPACATTNCYEATVTKVLPLALTRIVGYSGDAAYGSGRGQTVQAVAVATALILPVNDCLLALGSGGITFNGFKNGNLQGCTLGSGGDITCDGHDGDYRNINYAGTNKNGKCPDATQGTVTDPYADTITNNLKSIADPCGGSYSQEPAKKGDPALPATNQWSGSKSLPATTIICGDLQLTSTTTITSSASGSVLVIENGLLDLNGNTLSTAAASGLTIVFTGTNGGSYKHYPTANGTLDIAAPDATSGSAWEGVAMVQDPAITTNVSPSYSGNQPTWDITGLVYMPNANVDFGGVVNKSSNGFSCFTLVVSSVNVHGTGDIFVNNSQCAQAGVPTSGTAPLGAQLVF